MKEDFAMDFSYFNPFNPHQDKNSWQADPPFPLSKNDASHFLEEMARLIADNNYDFNTEKILASQTGNLKSTFENIANSPQAKLSSSELQDIEAFVSGKPIHFKEEKQNFQEEDLILKQKILLLAKVQEEQDLELYVLEKSIAKKDDQIKELINNPLENKLTKRNLEIELTEISLKDQEIIKINPQKLNKKDLLFHQYCQDDILKIQFSANWKKILWTQLSFMESYPIFIVNDREMGQNLFELTSNKDCIFVNDLRGNLPKSLAENQEILNFQSICIKNELDFSLLTIPRKVLYKHETATKLGQKELTFLLKAHFKINAI